MSAVARINRYESGEAHLAFWCAGCKMRHAVRVRAAGDVVDSTCWKWNGDLLNPTITPSIKVEWWMTDPKRQPKICHSFVTDGDIRYLSDCTHEHAGETFRLPLINNDPHDD